MAEGKNLVGVDIGTSSIKVCQVKESREGLGTLQRLGYAPLPPQTIVDGHVMDAGAVIETLQQVVPRRARSSSKEVALSVSGQSVIIRKITVPMMTPAELDEQIQWEAEQHIPFDIKDVQVDYQVLRKRPEASQMDLLARRGQARPDQRLRAARARREAQARRLRHRRLHRAEPVRACPAGCRRTRPSRSSTSARACRSLNIIANGVSAFTREIANGGNVITEEIQKQLGVPVEQAEAYKCGGAADRSDPSRRHGAPAGRRRSSRPSATPSRRRSSAAWTSSWPRAARPRSAAST